MDSSSENTSVSQFYSAASLEMQEEPKTEKNDIKNEMPIKQPESLEDTNSPQMNKQDQSSDELPEPGKVKSATEIRSDEDKPLNETQNQNAATEEDSKVPPRSKTSISQSFCSNLSSPFQIQI
jgi:hypothetical protein